MKNSKIEWTHHTFNPWWGCTKLSEACANCYAESMDRRCGGRHWGPDAPRRFFGEKHWAEPLKWNAEAAGLGVMHRVFCGSMCDVLESRPDVYGSRYRAFELAEATPHLLWLFLSKRPENMLEFYPKRWAGSAWPRNVMSGVTIENQRRLDERMSHVAAFQREFPGSRIFASCEPLLSALNWTEPQWRGDGNVNANGWLEYLDWVIGGGESGPRARPTHPDWARKLRDDCVNRDDMGRPWPLPFLWKQWGEWAPCVSAECRSSSCRRISRKGLDVTPNMDWWNPSDVAMAPVGKKAAGRLLDGREWNDFPMLPYGPQCPEVARAL